MGCTLRCCRCYIYIHYQLFANECRFRWVSCQFDILDECVDRRSVRKALADLPPTLYATYARILKAVRPDHTATTKRLLQFLTYSERPLRLEEAVDAVAVDTNSRPRFHTEDRLPVPQEVVRCCSSLVVLARKNDESATMEIQLAHLSVREYLMSDRLDADIASELQETTARAAIVDLCLSYLLELNHSSEPADSGYF